MNRFCANRFSCIFMQVVVFMRNRACSARAPPAAIAIQMMTAKCAGTNRRATITNVMMRALHQGKVQRVLHQRVGETAGDNTGLKTIDRPCNSYKTLKSTDEESGNK